MEVSQEISLCSYLKQAKRSFFLSFAISENRILEKVLPGVIDASGRREEVEKLFGGVNIVQILFTCVRKWKNYTC
jgi:hypothetical protein